MVVGVVIIGFGTSSPELLVSSVAAVGGNPEIAVGNIVGSNIANLSLLLGIGAIIVLLAVASSTVRGRLRSRWSHSPPTASPSRVAA